MKKVASVYSGHQKILVTSVLMDFNGQLLNKLDVSKI